MKKEDIENMTISLITIIQLERILNYLVQNKEHTALFSNVKITYQDEYKDSERG